MGMEGDVGMDGFHFRVDAEDTAGGLRHDLFEIEIEIEIELQ
jgi:hypothetical protein